ncbi:hypothetical protein CEXT_443551 [Caerostris extrusa]|uniref:Uncharacterized protein n=1 Tax=Caerostris extrusa TaxID=172846 RepID=A0AAV4SCD1_CAEEX|nr:hypothetical protein CEXT_443551 [Caerostris extrusa]
MASHGRPSKEFAAHHKSFSFSNVFFGKSMLVSCAPCEAVNSPSISQIRKLMLRLLPQITDSLLSPPFWTLPPLTPTHSPSPRVIRDLRVYLGPFLKM